MWFLGIKVFESHIKQWVAYAEVMGIGKTVMEVEPEGVAAMDSLNLFVEVIEWSGGQFRYTNPRDYYRESVRPYLGQSNLKLRLLIEKLELTINLVQGDQNITINQVDLDRIADPHLREQMRKLLNRVYKVSPDR